MLGNFLSSILMGVDLFQKCLFYLLIPVICSCKVSNNPKPLKYNIYKYTGSISYDSANMFRVDVYSLDDYLVRVELLTCKASDLTFRIDRKKDSAVFDNQTQAFTYCDTVSVSLINVKTGVQVFCNTLNTDVEIDSLASYKGEQSLIQFEPDSSSAERNKLLRDTMINNIQLQYSSSEILSSKGEDSISVFLFYSNENGIYNLLNFPEFDRYLGLKLFIHSQDLLLEQYVGRIDYLTPSETYSFNHYISIIKEKYNRFKDVHPECSGLIF